MDNLIARQNLNTDQQLMVNAELNKKKKSVGIAYLLWFFLGSVGGHRFYAGDIGLGIFYLVLFVISCFTLFIPTGIMCLIDLFLIGKRIDKVNDRLEADIIKQVKLVGKRNNKMA
ncbi:TM2 domain-containing protein [Brevibacillus laterosporus]|uniref:TM2 domain-containing protein n=1 Tax=Brevibacillus laterosporus TaxID=1465 RepID=A0A502IU24_BRELA|nr:TM2 domain-containing protein [Brevibacillus laterosporus]QDX95423.1 TM2 domain-containing protein [Brevibacillus laterosporus]RAP26317.1 hypothetical protein C2W64_01992 [Brevibacillus laterosporus]TPG69333.1 TM2 domain-containing protein [Brevibacillus laterosporus]TPG89178.1 TM2 domain-containing protein [Brevibacillus laterosporus]